MPIPKRWFHVSQDLNSDPELWAFTAQFGDRSLRTWLQILVCLDRSDNRWRTSGDWLATLSRMVRQSVANVSRQVGWMTANGWLRVRETAADGSPLVYEAPNWPKYNRRQEHKGNASVPDTGSDSDPLLSFPTPNLSFPTPKNKKKRAGSTSSSPAGASTAKRKVQLSDEEFLAALRKNSAYKHLDIDAELGKLDAWLLTPRGRGKEKTRQRIVAWLNRAADEQRPMTTVTSPSAPAHCRERQSNGRHSQPCTNPSVPGELYCSDHLPIRQRIAERLANGKAS